MRRRFKILWVGVALLILFAFLYLPGLSRYQELRLEEERLGRELAQLDKQIQNLQEEKELLEKDQDYLEKVIREELGLVKPGEMIYKLVPEKEPTEPPESH
ncbi:MAG: septum formation initiator family protein [Candidatus Omnitrophica bacterium]|nr:septum formation initiator family protein [Candidatus Omnitrophota bacterium]